MFDLANVQDLLQNYGYWIILIWTFLEGETIVILAGLLSKQVGLKPEFIALAAFCGSFCSDQVMFILGQLFGPAIFRKFPRLEKNTDKVRAMMRKYENLLILGFRFVYGIRNITPIMLGMSKVSHLKFVALNAIGAAVWALAFSFGGYYFGELFAHVVKKAGHGAAFALVGVIAVAAVIWWVRRKRDHAAVKQAIQASGVEEHAVAPEASGAQEHSVTPDEPDRNDSDRNKTGHVESGKKRDAPPHP